MKDLTPAPWDCVAIDTDEGSFNVYQAKHPYFVEIANVDTKADAEFICLAREAFDVLMRRGWPIYWDGKSEWLCRIPNLSTYDQGGGFVAPDPFTALVEADKWYRENIEAKESKP